MSGIDFARRELDMLIVEGSDNTMQLEINKCIMDLVELFSSQEHSGATANYTKQIFSRLVSYLPLSPLTGEDDEWRVVISNEDRVLEQNLRCPSVFRENRDNSTAYLNRAILFSDDGGETWFSDNNSSISISFPFDVPSEPKRVILTREENADE